MKGYRSRVKITGPSRSDYKTLEEYMDDRKKKRQKALLFRVTQPSEKQALITRKKMTRKTSTGATYTANLSRAELKCWEKRGKQLRDLNNITQRKLEKLYRKGHILKHRRDVNYLPQGVYVPLTKQGERELDALFGRGGQAKLAYARNGFSGFRAAKMAVKAHKTKDFTLLALDDKMKRRFGYDKRDKILAAHFDLPEDKNPAGQVKLMYKHARRDADHYFTSIKFGKNDTGMGSVIIGKKRHLEAMLDCMSEYVMIRGI